MTNLTPLVIPLISIIVGVIPIFFFKKNLPLFAIAFLSYFIAIIAKILIQSTFLGFFHTPSIPTYLSYGILTTVLEPGFAYLFLLVFKPKGLNANLGLSYGAYLAFCENAVLLGVLSLPNYLIVSLSISASQILAHTLDRLSSFLLHTFWGFSATLSMTKKDLRYLLISMPYGMTDSLAAYYDFTHAIPLLVFSTIVLLISLSSIPLMVYWYKKAALQK